MSKDRFSFLKEIISVIIASVAFPGLNISVKPGLQKVNLPKVDSPILVTSNYFITVKRVRKYLETNNITCWLLIIDTGGVNVWCSAAGQEFTAEKILEGIRETKLEEKVNHKQLILPQLSAAGVDNKILERAEWEPVFGPVAIKDFKNFLKNNSKKGSKESEVTFPIKSRLELAISHNFFISLILIPLIVSIGFLAGSLYFFQPWAEWLSGNLGIVIIYFWFIGFIFAIIYTHMPFRSGFLSGLLIVVPVSIILSLLYQESMIMSGFNFLFFGTFTTTDFDGFTPYISTNLFIKDLMLNIIFILPLLIIILLISGVGA